MRERPILFGGPMVRAILDGRKTQTRREVRNRHFSPEFHARCPAVGVEQALEEMWGTPHIRCPYGAPGDRLWVRETWGFTARIPSTAAEQSRRDRFAPDGWLAYRADAPEGLWCWRSPIHMPRWASRITLEITDVRAQRLQEISDGDIDAEGFDGHYPPKAFPEHAGTTGWFDGDASMRQCFSELWDCINGKKTPWENNPWVWATTFRRVRP